MIARFQNGCLFDLKSARPKMPIAAPVRLDPAHANSDFLCSEEIVEIIFDFLCHFVEFGARPFIFRHHWAPPLPFPVLSPPQVTSPAGVDFLHPSNLRCILVVMWHLFYELPHDNA